MRVLVTGATGFVGSHVTRALLADGHEVRALVRDAGKLERVAALHGIRIEDYCVGDITDASAVRSALAGCEAAVHTAAVIVLDEGGPQRAASVNVDGTRNVLGAAAEMGLRRIVHLSSIAALYRAGGPPINASAAVAHLNDSYGRTKADAETYARTLQDGGVPLSTVYPPGTIGPLDPGLSDTNRALVEFANLVAPVTSTGCNFVDVRDVATAVARLATAEAPVGRWVLGGHYVTWAELARALRDVGGLPVRRLWVPGPLLRATGSVADALRRFVRIDYPITRDTAAYATRWPGVDSGNSEAALGVRFRPFESSLAETLGWLVERGFIRRTGPTGPTGPSGRGAL